MAQALATASVSRWDNIETVKTALEYGFTTVQLFIDPLVRQDKYRAELIQLLKSTQLILVLHLPDIEKENPDLNAEYIRITEEIVSTIDNKVTILIHHTEDMNEDSIPKILGKPVALENSKTGFYDPQSVTQPLELCRAVNVPFVFDWERILYTKQPDGTIVSESEIIVFIKSVLEVLDPSRDIIHLRDKFEWSIPYRQSITVFPKGINKAFIEEIKGFERAGGLVVWEYEQMDLTLASLKALAEL